MTCGKNLRGDKRAALWIGATEAKDLYKLGCRQRHFVFEMMQKFKLSQYAAESVWSESAPEFFKGPGSTTAEQRGFTNKRYEQHYAKISWLEKA